MSTIARLATGSLFMVGNGGTPIETYTTIPEVMRLRGPSSRFDLLDVSSHDSGTYREFIPGFADGDNVNAEVNWRPSNTVHKFLRTTSDNQALRSFRVVFPDISDNTVSFSAYVENIEPVNDAGAPMRASVRCKVTGPPVWT